MSALKVYSNGSSHHTPYRLAAVIHQHGAPQHHANQFTILVAARTAREATAMVHEHFGEFDTRRLALARGTNAQQVQDAGLLDTPRILIMPVSTHHGAIIVDALTRQVVGRFAPGARVEPAAAPRIFAEVSASGTAIPETALCETHNNADQVARFPAEKNTDPGSGVREDCTGNEALTCQVCGAGVDAEQA